MTVWYEDHLYFVNDLIPEYVPLPTAYARINGRLSYSNYYLLTY